MAKRMSACSPSRSRFSKGTTPDDTIHKLPLTASNIATGKQIVGKGGLGCISCHDIGGMPNTGTRGPDLATINQRVRYEWYERWLHQPLRMAPGTRMPQAFVDGKSTLTTVLNGNPDAQAEAMWAYLSLGPGLPLPEGLEPPKGLIIAVKERPELLRTFMPDAGSKAIAVGYPGSVIGRVQCRPVPARVCLGWELSRRIAGVEQSRRRPAEVARPKFWTAPRPPVGADREPRIPPDFLARANNPAFGMPLPLEPARIYDGPRAVEFDGYSLDSRAGPRSATRLKENAKGAVLKVAETPLPLKSAVATGFLRKFALESPAGYRAWLFAGESTNAPRVVSAEGAKSIALDLKSEEPLVLADGVRVVLPQDADRSIVLEAIDAPAGSAWRFVPKPGGGWLVMLRLPELKDGWKGQFELALWALPKNDDALLKDLSAR